MDWGAVAFPESVQGVVTNRIDRLQPAHQLTLKVSSVIGRLFPYRVLRDVFPIEPEKPQLPRLLGDLKDLDFTLVESEDPDFVYLFKHVIIRDVSYNMLLFSQRRQIHRSIAAWYERTQADDLSPYYPLLAHHWTLAEEEDKAIEALGRAAEQALRGGAYQEAVTFLLDAIRLDEQARTRAGEPANVVRVARWEAQLGEAYLGLGRLIDCQKHTETALHLMGQCVPKSIFEFVTHFASQIGRQTVHRFFPARYVGRSHADAESFRQAARAFDVIMQVCYYSQDLALCVYSALRALNLAESSGHVPSWHEATPRCASPRARSRSIRWPRSTANAQGYGRDRRRPRDRRLGIGTHGGLLARGRPLERVPGAVGRSRRTQPTPG